MQLPKIPHHLILREATRREGFRGFAKQAWGYIDTAPLTWGWHMDAICDHLQAVQERQIKRLVICIPPRHAKSSLSGPLFHAYCFAKFPTESILRASYTQSLVNRDSSRTLDLMRSSAYQKAFPAVGTVPKMAAVHDWRTSNGGALFSTSMRGKATGMGSRLQLIDDGSKAADVHGTDPEDPAMLRQVVELFTDTFSTRVNGSPDDFCRVVIGQRLHPMDLPGVCMNELGFESLVLPYEYDPAVYWDCRSSLNFKDPRKEKGERLFSLYAGEAGDRLLAEMPNKQAREAQLQQNPSAGAGGVVEREWISETYEALPTTPNRITWVQAWDLSAKGNLSSHSRCAGLLAGVYQNNVYIHHVVFGHWNFVEVKKIFEDLQLEEDWARTKHIHIEAKANGVPLLDSLAYHWTAPERGKTPLARKLRHWDPKNVSKIDRLRAVTPVLAAGRVKLRAGAGWRDAFIDEVSAFPSAPYDDLPDILSQLLDVVKITGGSLSQAANNI